MAACSGLGLLFENPVSENPTLLESLSSSWNHIKPISTMDQSSVTEIFGELHFNEKPSSEKEMNKNKAATVDDHVKEHGSSMDSLLGRPETKSKNQGFGSYLDLLSGVPQKSTSTESLQLCTEGLGFESSDEVEDSKSETGENLVGERKEEEVGGERRCPIGYCRRNLGVQSSRGDMPPPISCIGSCGKPWIFFQSIKRDGRFVDTTSSHSAEEQDHIHVADSLLEEQSRKDVAESTEEQLRRSSRVSKQPSWLKGFVQPSNIRSKGES